MWPGPALARSQAQQGSRSLGCTGVPAYNWDLRSHLISLFALLLGAAGFVAATGLLGTAVSLRAASLGFSGAVLGLVLSAYFAGFVIGTYIGPRIVRRTGHIRAFSVFAATACAAVLLHVVFVSAAWWALLRLLTGASVVGMYMVLESWLNERSTNEQRGAVFSAYQAVSLLSLGLGQYLLLVDPGSEIKPFVLTGVLLALALLPVALTRVPEPKPVRPAKLGLRHLWSVSPLGVLGTFCTALAGSLLFALGPIYALQTGMTKDGVALFMSVIIFGGAVLQWPIGRLSDAFDRRTVILYVAIGAAVLAFAAIFARGLGSPIFFAVVFLYGGAVFSLYPLCVAHAGDHVSKDQVVETASGLLLVYGLGATAGPFLGGSVMGAFGPGLFFVMLAAVLGTLAVTAAVRMWVRAAPPVSAQENFVPLARTSQSALEMLPDVAKTDDQQRPVPE